MGKSNGESLAFVLSLVPLVGGLFTAFSLPFLFSIPAQLLPALSGSATSWQQAPWSMGEQLLFSGLIHRPRGT